MVTVLASKAPAYVVSSSEITSGARVVLADRANDCVADIASSISSSSSCGVAATAFIGMRGILAWNARAVLTMNFWSCQQQQQQRQQEKREK